MKSPPLLNLFKKMPKRTLMTAYLDKPSKEGDNSNKTTINHIQFI